MQKRNIPGRAVLIALLPLLILGFLLFVVSSRAGAEQEPWPTFVMVYEELSYPNGPHGVKETDVWRLEYNNRRSWRLYLEESTREPRMTGLRESFEGTMYTSGPGALAAGVSREITDGYAIPADWLAPGLHTYITESPRNFQRVADVAIPLRVDFKPVWYTRTVTLPCSSEAAVSCPEGQSTYSMTEYIAFTEEHGIPVRLVEKASEQLVRNVTVIALRVDE